MGGGQDRGPPLAPGRLTSIPSGPAREAAGALGRLAALDDQEPQGKLKSEGFVRR